MKEKIETSEGQKVEEKEIKKKTKIEIKNEVIVVTLGTSISFNDKKIEKLELDFNSLTGVDICYAESDALGRFYTPLPDTNYSTAYQAAIAAKASGMPFDVILKISKR